MSGRPVSPYARLVARVAEEAWAWILQVEDDDFKGGSPIERIFITALSMVTKFGCREYDHARIYSPDNPFDPTALVDKNRPILFVDQQKQLPDWRVDFLIHVWSHGFPWPNKKSEPGWHRLIVECDGHDFHERTKKQAQRDRARDRWAQEQNIAIFRFTGSEIYREPWKCAEQVIDWAVSRCF